MIAPSLGDLVVPRIHKPDFPVHLKALLDYVGQSSLANIAQEKFNNMAAYAMEQIVLDYVICGVFVLPPFLPPSSRAGGLRFSSPAGICRGGVSPRWEVMEGGDESADELFTSMFGVGGGIMCAMWGRGN